MQSYYMVKNWGLFQHYKDRNPPWIKLHYELLSSETWVMLDDASRVLAVACMLIASRNEGTVPNNPDYLKRVAYLNKLPNFKPLLDCGFLEKTLADDSGCKQLQADARPETETEKRQSKKEMVIPDGIILPSNWPSFVKFRKEIKKPITETQIEGIIKKANKLAGECNCTPEEILQEAIDNGWRGLFKISKGNENGTYQQNTGKGYERTQAEDEIWKGVI